LAAAQRPVSIQGEDAAPTPRVGPAVGAALLLAVAATLVLGIAPGEVLRAAAAGAHTLEAPVSQTGAPATASPADSTDARPAP